MYLVLRPPWRARVATVAPAGPPVVMIGTDAGVAKPKPKRRRPNHPVPPTSGQPGDGELDDGEPLPVLSAADRALEWRGDDVALPTQTIDLSHGGREARPLDDGEISAGIAAGGGGVKDCVVQGATNTDLRATITLKLLVDGRGRVTRSRLQAPRYLLDHGLLGCTQRALGRLHFAATGGATIVTLPIKLD